MLAVVTTVTPDWLADLLSWPDAMQQFEWPHPLEIEAAALARATRERAKQDEMFREVLSELLGDADLVVTVHSWMRHHENRRLPMLLKDV